MPPLNTTSRLREDNHAGEYLVITARIFHSTFQFFFLRGGGLGVTGLNRLWNGTVMEKTCGKSKDHMEEDTDGGEG